MLPRLSSPGQYAAPLLALLTLPLSGQTLHPLPPAAPGLPVRLESPFQSQTLLRLEASPDLSGWTETGRFHDALYPWPDGRAGTARQSFYRLLTGPRTAADDWKNQLVFPDDAFRAAASSETPRWVKFSIRPAEPWRVYFQDSVKYPFHYEFATQRLTPFHGLSRPAFDAISLRRTGQQIVLGAVLFPPNQNLKEFAVQFVGLDPYTPDEIAPWFKSVKNAVHATTGAAAFYMPVFEQSESARRDAAQLEARGVPLATLDRWISTDHVYSSGWALGRLKYVPAAEISAAFLSGQLLSTDILLTDGIPAETPPVAGLISLTPSTPNSHTAILAQSFGIPFVHLPNATAQARARQLDGRKVILRAFTRYYENIVHLIEVQDSMPPAVEASLLALKAPQPIAYPPKQTHGAISAVTDTLLPVHRNRFGGKSVNYGLLRRTIPANTPPAVSFSFDLWDTFMDQILTESNRTLRAEIAARLAPHQTWPPQMMALKTTLSGIRDLIRRTASFTPAQQQSVLDALAGFDPARKIRFRSSTNVEDGETFTGAGLYDSYSGCILDDLDNNTAGPCACDAADLDERGVFRAIQRVFASFYNDNAYLERLRHGVTESETAMGVLAHHSYPDENELANGVATLDYRFAFFSQFTGSLVTQAGAEPVANPTGAAQPEVIEVYRSGTSIGLTPRQSSSRVPLGAQVLAWQSDYNTFTDLFMAAGTAWRSWYPAKNNFTLDFEYKKDRNLGLIVKQVRAIPPAPAYTDPAWLIDSPNVLVVAQKEAGSVFGNHRLKTLWNLRTGNGQLTAPFLAAGLYQNGTVQYHNAGTLHTLTGPLASWPDASVLSPGTTQRWTTGSSSAQRTWQLNTSLTTTVSAGIPPVVLAEDFATSVAVTYATPQPDISFNGTFTTTSSDTIFLESPRPLTPGSIPVERQAANSQGVQIVTRFYWPDEPPTAGGYTAPLVKFNQTTLTGLTSQPITLTGYFSQTYRPGHHNFTEEFIFEPALEPGLPAHLLTELTAANIQAIYLKVGSPTPTIVAISPAGELRRL
jgi:hypothetical protein